MRFEIDGTKLYTIKDGPRDSNRGGGNRQSEGGFGSGGGFGGGGFDGNKENVGFGDLTKLIDKQNESFGRGDGGQGRRQGADSLSGNNMRSGDNSFNNQVKSNESGSVAARNNHYGVLIDEINENDLYDSNHVAGVDFDRYKKTEVSAHKS